MLWWLYFEFVFFGFGGWGGVEEINGEYLYEILLVFLFGVVIVVIF